MGPRRPGSPIWPVSVDDTHLLQFAVGLARQQPRRGGGADHHGVDPDAERTQLYGHQPAQSLHAGLGGGICRRPGPHAVGRHRADVDDRTAFLSATFAGRRPAP